MSCLISSVFPKAGLDMCIVKGKIKFHTMLSVRWVVSHHNALKFLFYVRPQRQQKALNRKDDGSRAGGIQNSRRKYKAER